MQARIRPSTKMFPLPSTVPDLPITSRFSLTPGRSPQPRARPDPWSILQSLVRPRDGGGGIRTAVRPADDERKGRAGAPPARHDLAVLEHRPPSVWAPFVFPGGRRLVPAERPSFRLRARFGIYRRIRLALLRDVPRDASLGES